MTGSVHVGPLVVESDGAVTADVDGAAVRFASPDASLDPAAEAFAGPMWLPALDRGADMHVEGAVDPTWRHNLGRVADLAASWWGFAPRRADAPDRVADTAAPGTAVCFTGGVDSFFTLLTTSPRPDALVFVHGFDIALHERERWSEASAGHRAVAAAMGCRPITVRTDLREHPSFARLPWDTTHGSALAAVGHLLRAEHGRLLISSTHARSDGRAWGSDWRLDPLWSAADLAVVHVGDDTPREEKIRAIAVDPLVRAHLRVCWEHRDQRLNCGACDKCLATMVILQAAGALDEVATFDGGCDLVARLDDLDATLYLAMYPRVLAGDGVPPAVAAAVRRLLVRSEVSRVG